MQKQNELSLNSQLLPSNKWQHTIFAYVKVRNYLTTPVIWHLNFDPFTEETVFILFWMSFSIKTIFFLIHTNSLMILSKEIEEKNF